MAGVEGFEPSTRGFGGNVEISSHAPASPRFWGFVASRAADASRIDAFLMICEILHPIFDALDDEFGFRGLGCGGNYESVRRAKWQIGNAQNLRRIKQRKGLQQLIQKSD